jgi:hypothetical protein
MPSLISLSSFRLIVFLFVVSRATEDGEGSLLSGDPCRPSRDQEVQQIGTVIEQDGDSRSVIMPVGRGRGGRRWLAGTGPSKPGASRGPPEGSQQVGTPAFGAGPDVGVLVGELQSGGDDASAELSERAQQLPGVTA